MIQKPFLYRLLFFFLASWLCTLAGCKKENERTPREAYYVNFKLDGQQMSMTDSVVAVSQSGTANGVSVYSFVVAGYTREASTNNWGSWFVVNTAFFNNPVQPKTYFSPIYNEDDDEQFYLTYFAGCPACYTYGANHFLSTYRNVTIAFSEINDKYVKGTFSGTLLLNEPEEHPGKNVSMEITDGEFYAPVLIASEFHF